MMKTSVQSLAQPYWVLIVDNDGMLADAYERIIERAGGRPLSVGTVKDAIVVLKNKRVDIVLVDIRLPAKDGMELLEWIDVHTRENLVRIVLSNLDDVHNITRAYELGADRYVLKALASPNDLIKALNDALAYSMRKPRRQLVNY